MTSETNVADVERWASALGGAALTAFAVKQLKDRSPAGVALAAAGTALIYRGATGHCPVYGAAGINTASGEDDTRAALSGSRGVNVEEVTTINRSPSELYRFWRNFERLPAFMEHLVSVKQTDQRRSHWVAKAPAGRTVEWDAEIINEIPDELIGWRTLDGADVISAGSVRFVAARGGRGTEVRVRLQYEPPGGKVGSAIAWMFGEEPSQTIQEDLRRFKQLMEAGEVPTTEGQPRGRR
ncbi:MAG TPA: SRPBCC family protein [Vicinamibacterales bacterium]|nr:SRPBCC family protein [Vicinamibacterales bacterium]